MIVVKLWIDKRYSRLGYLESVAEWKGYYLFGFIPLYKKMLSIKYTR